MASTSGSSTAVASTSSTSDKEQTEARAAVLASLQSAGSTYDSQLQRRTADLHENSAAISKQEAELKKHLAAMQKDTNMLESEWKKADRSVRDIGHVQNWAEMLERDLMILEETMRNVEGGERVETASGGSIWK